MISFKHFFAIAFAVLAAVISPGHHGIQTNASTASVAQASADEAPRIRPAEVRELLKKNKAVLIDVRSHEAYKASHIKGALNIPYGEIVDRAGELPRDKMIITYCS